MKVLFATAVSYNGEIIPANTPIEVTKEEYKSFENVTGWVLVEDKPKEEKEEPKKEEPKAKPTTKKK